MDTPDLVDFMIWMTGIGIKFEIPSPYQQIMSGMYLKEDKFYELCDNYIYSFNPDEYNPFEDLWNK